MIISFGDKDTKRLWETGKSKKYSNELIDNFLRKLNAIDKASLLEDLNIPSYRLHKLKGQLKDYYSITVSIIDYHK